MLGRTIRSSDDNDPNVVVLGFEMWRASFNSDPAAVGQVIEFRSGNLAGRLFTIVGVMPQGTELLATSLDLYMPVVLPPNARPLGLSPLIGRLRDGGSLAEANQENNAIGAALRAPRPASAPPLTRPRFEVVDLKDPVVREMRPALNVFLAAVAVLLLIVCANVANLLLARGSARQREIAVRMALGATRARIVRQILAECVLLAAAGRIIVTVSVRSASLSSNNSPRSTCLECSAWHMARPCFRAQARWEWIWQTLGIALGIAALTSVVFGVPCRRGTSPAPVICRRWARVAVASAGASRAFAPAVRRWAIGDGNRAPGRRRVAGEQLPQLGAGGERLRPHQGPGISTGAARRLLECEKGGDGSSAARPLARDARRRGRRLCLCRPSPRH